MGCDIHIYREKLVDGQWVTADTWALCKWNKTALSHDEIGGSRNYALFYCLAGIRRNGDGHPFSFAPRGMPITASAEVLNQYEEWDGVGHSHSFLYLHELEELLSVLEKNMVPVSGMKEKTELARFREAVAANEPGCWDLRKIIEGLKSAGGDNQRIVFWFDS